MHNNFKRPQTWHQSFHYCLQNDLWRRMTTTLSNSQRKKTSHTQSQPNLLTLQQQQTKQSTPIIFVPKNTRTSRHLIKKASKQMKREQKATVTLAIVLGKIIKIVNNNQINFLVVFLGCWVPFFTLHLSNVFYFFINKFLKINKILRQFV